MNPTTSAPKWTTPGTVAARASIWVIVGYCLWQGAGIIVGGAVRWSGPAYTFLRDTPGAPASWGWAIITAGLLLGTASLMTNWYLKLIAIVTIVTWSLGFAYGAQYATLTVPVAGTTGGPIYVVFAILAAILVLPDEARKAV